MCENAGLHIRLIPLTKWYIHPSLYEQVYNERASIVCSKNPQSTSFVLTGPQFRSVKRFRHIESFNLVYVTDIFGTKFADNVEISWF